MIFGYRCDQDANRQCPKHHKQRSMGRIGGLYDRRTFDSSILRVYDYIYKTVL